jgi:hypothetical protein
LDPSEISGDNLNNIRRVASGYLRNKKLEYLKDKINKRTVGTRILEACIEEYIQLMNDENGNMLADSHNIFNGAGTHSYSKYVGSVMLGR